MIILVFSQKRKSQPDQDWLFKLPFDALEWGVGRMVDAVAKRLSVKSSRKTYEHQGLHPHSARVPVVQTD
jgi:hypothetical protein